MESSVEPVIWPGGQLVQLSTSGFIFSSVGRVSRSSPPSQTKRHARELATYSFITWVVLDTTIFIHTYIIVIMRMEVISCFYLCSLIQFQRVGGATSFMAAGPGFWQCCAHWICAFFKKPIPHLLLGLRCRAARCSVASVLTTGMSSKSALDFSV